MKKPTVYLDTSIVSAYWFEGAEVTMLSRRLRTREWWEFERQHFHVLGSALAETELRRGVYSRQAECLKTIRRLPYLPTTGEVDQFAEKLLAHGVVPRQKPADAAHLATSALHDIDYLLTWNYAHMANPVVQERFERLCEALELVAPIMVSPETIPQVRLGQTIRRKR